MQPKPVQPQELRRVRTGHQFAAGVVNCLDQFFAQLDPTRAFFKWYCLQHSIAFIKIEPLLLDLSGVEFEVRLCPDLFFCSESAERVFHKMMCRIYKRV